jgi:4-alpha-glucanotransferase
VTWWEEATPGERQAVLDIPSIRDRTSVDDRARAVNSPTMTPEVRATLLEALCASGSDLAILPIQDAFGWRARINQPATVNAHNWTWKLPWASDRLLSEPEALGVAQQLRECAQRHGRV